MVQTKHIAVVFLAVSLSGCGSAVLEELVSPKTPTEAHTAAARSLGAVRDRARRIAANIAKLPELQRHLTRDEAAGAVDEALTLLRPRPLRR